MAEPIELNKMPGASPPVASEAAGEAVEEHKSVHALLVRWQHGLRINHVMHSRASTSYERRGRALGVVTVLLATAVSAGIFSTFKDSLTDWQRTVAGVLSGAAAVAASIQTFLGYSDLTERHRRCAIEYGSVRRRVEQTLESRLPTGDDLSQIREAWDAIEKDAPPIPQWIVTSVRREMMTSASGEPATDGHEPAVRGPSPG
jgi:hypothetical protein